MSPDALRTALDLYEVGEGIMRQQLRRVARAGHLIALELLARDDETRPQDAGELRALAAVADAEDLRLAVDAVALIESRGFHRDRDLGAALPSLRA